MATSEILNQIIVKAKKQYAATVPQPEPWRLKAAITGQSGTGKSSTALLLAWEVLGRPIDPNKICLIDLEGRANRVADIIIGHTRFYVPHVVVTLPLEDISVFSVEEIIKQQLQRGTECFILDTGSDVWGSVKKLVDLVSAEAAQKEEEKNKKFDNNKKNTTKEASSYTQNVGWNIASPLYAAFLRFIGNGPFHLIATYRGCVEEVKTEEYERDEKGNIKKDERGRFIKTTVSKTVGRIEWREGLGVIGDKYFFDVVINISLGAEWSAEIAKASGTISRGGVLYQDTVVSSYEDLVSGILAAQKDYALSMEERKIRTANAESMVVKETVDEKEEKRKKVQTYKDLQSELQQWDCSQDDEMQGQKEYYLAFNPNDATIVQLKEVGTALYLFLKALKAQNALG